MSSLSRRSFVKTGTLGAAALPLASLLSAQSQSASSAPAAPGVPRSPAPAPAQAGRAPISWLEGVPAAHGGATLGVP